MVMLNGSKQQFGSKNLAKMHDRINKRTKPCWNHIGNTHAITLFLSYSQGPDVSGSLCMKWWGPLSLAGLSIWQIQDLERYADRIWCVFGTCLRMRKGHDSFTTYQTFFTENHGAENHMCTVFSLYIIYSCIGHRGSHLASFELLECLCCLWSFMREHTYTPDWVFKNSTWVCLKMLCTPKPNGFADHDPVFKWLFHWEY